MNSLLKRQIRKYLPKDLQGRKDLDVFLDAINKSYNTSEDQFVMLQRATTISSEELFEASEKLKEETNSQREVIEKLKTVIDTLQFYDLEENKPLENSDSLKLVDFIDNQTKEILKINKQKDKLLRNLAHQNRELNDYAHMVSHDLKSPLQSLDALTSWLKDDYGYLLDSQGKETIKLIRQNVQKIDTLVKAIFKYSTIGKINKKQKEINLNSLIKLATRELQIPCEVKIIIPETLPTIKGDVYSIEQLFINLICNAVKFNDKENKTVEIGFTEKTNNWEFYVKDNGNGIDEKYFKKIFTAFNKLEDDYKSAGIGLSIVKKITDIYFGKVWLESKINVGSTFYFTIKK